MSYKRSRSTFEADQHAPFAVFGTPLPDEAEARDDGSYVPLWKQEVRDERGRKRLHGAFTGGWSAGYFNTVGSKEGWTPSTFVSSRASRRKDDTAKNQPRPEDYMDEEDLADAAESQKLQTSDAFAGLGSNTQNQTSSHGFMGLFRPSGDTMGLRLLRKMGWKDGQGIGPKVRRAARLDMGNGAQDGSKETYLFAPEDSPMIQFTRKTDKRGLGHDGEARLTTIGGNNEEVDEDEDSPFGSAKDSKPSKPGFGNGLKKEAKGIGVGILNDNGSDEEDPYEIGPKIRYNRVIGADKKKKKARKQAGANPALSNAPVFVSKSSRLSGALRRCHDGRLPLDGFVLAKLTEDMSTLMSQYAPPAVPEGWISSRKDGSTLNERGEYVSAADAARASKLDPKSRAAILGEQALPGKSVFDFISTSARDRLAAGSGKQNLPPAKGEIPEGFPVSEEAKQREMWEKVPKLDRETAVAAISRSALGPYADDEAKKSRYRAYLDYQADHSRPPPPKPPGVREDDFVSELKEFYNCARIFKPMTGFMASRFTTAKTTTSISKEGAGDGELLSKPEPKSADPAEEAAKMGMFGRMTRSVTDFYPTRLLCKRFNVRPPENSEPDADPEAQKTAPGDDTWPSFTSSGPAPASTAAEPVSDGGTKPPVKALPAPDAPLALTEPERGVNPEKNEAVEGKAAPADVLRAIFGDSDSDSE